MTYFKLVHSLKEMATSQVAINLCQDNSFKEVALRLEKPPINDLDEYNFYKSEYNFYTNQFDESEDWDEALDGQCHRLTQKLPQSLKQGVHIWISRVAYEYLSYHKRMESLFGVTGNFLMSIITRQDWTDSCRLDEKKLAKKLLRDERLTVLQRYRIACVYCLHINIPHLWNKLLPEQKKSITERDVIPRYLWEKSDFVLLWSYYMDGHRQEKLTGEENNLWMYATGLAIEYGNKAILLQCWKKLNKNIRKQRIIIDWAHTSARIWKKFENRDKWKADFLYNVYEGSDKQTELMKRFSLPYYYSELMYFFLSKMHKRQQLTFFQEAFRYNLSGSTGFSILNGFLEWPLQDYFLPTVRRLWGIIPKEKYGHCLLKLARNYSDAEENLFYDYYSVLWNLWKGTPEKYKQYVSHKKIDSWGSYSTPVIENLLPTLLDRTPFKNKDAALFRRVWQDIPQARKAEIMCTTESGFYICRLLVEKRMWSSLNELLEECLPNEEIPNYKRKFVERWGVYDCMIKLGNNNEKYVTEFINWAFDSDRDKKQFKYEVIIKKGVEHWTYLLEQGKMSEMECIINFYLSSEEMKLQFKTDVVKAACRQLLKDYAWEKMDKIVALIFDTEEKIIIFKRDFFNSDDSAINTVHYNLVFKERSQWENIEKLYEWFCLSSEEITELKRKTVFDYTVFEKVNVALSQKEVSIYKKELVKSLNWCLVDDEMAICFREQFEKCFLQVNRATNNKKQRTKQSYTKIRTEERREQFHSFMNELQICRKQVNHEETEIKKKKKKN